MLGALHDKINNSPPLYFLLGWLWTSGFGSTPLSLRLFSSAGIGLATLVTWLSLRSVYDFRSASIGTLAVFCSSKIILYQNAEARMYGMYLAIASLLVLQFQINNSTKRRTRGLLVSNACIHGALVNIHLFGLVYSGAFLGSLAQMAIDKSRGIFRTNLYAAIVLSWATLILYVPSFFNELRLLSPRFWLPRPSASDFYNLLIDTAPAGPIVAMLGCLALFFGFLALLRRSDCTVLGDTPDRGLDLESSLIAIACTFLVIPVAVFVIAWIEPLFLGKDMIPSALIWPSL